MAKNNNALIEVDEIKSFHLGRDEDKKIETMIVNIGVDGRTHRLVIRRKREQIDHVKTENN